MEIYVWIDGLNLQSKPKKHFARDFSDGVLCAEILLKTTKASSSSSSSPSSRFRNAQISMHNYPIKNSFKGKMENWELLNSKVLRTQKIQCELTREEMSAVARSEKDAAERVLLKIKTAVEDDVTSFVEEEEEEEEEPYDETEIEEERKRLAPASNDAEREEENLREAKEEEEKEKEKEESESQRQHRETLLLKEKEAIISQLTLKVEALTAKCAKLEQLLVLLHKKRTAERSKKILKP